MIAEKIIKTTHYKLILILDQLERKEWRALKKFILMYTREQSDNFDLYTLLRKNIDRLNTNEDVKKLHAEYFPQMTPKTFFNMLSRLTLWVEDWMVYEDMRKSDQRDIRLIRLYNSRGLYKESNAIANKAIKTAKNEPGLSLIATENLAKIYYYQYFSDNPIKFDKTQNLLNKLISYQLNSINNITNLLNTQCFYAKKETNPLHPTLEKVIKLLPKNELTEMFGQLKKLIVDANYKSLLNLKKMLESDKILDKSDLHILIILYTFNGTLSLWSKNKFTNSSIIEQVVNYYIEHALLTVDDKIESNMWNNLISIISSTRTFNEASEFIEKWYQKVSVKDHSSLKSLSYAQACFHQEKFEEIRGHIYAMDRVEQLQKYRVNSLIIISMFKDRHNNYKIFMDFATNFIRQLERTKNKEKTSNYIAYKNLVLTLISLAKSEYTKSNIRIEDSRYILYRSWLRKEIKKADTKY